MNKNATLAASSLLAMIVAMPAFAQETVTGIDALEDQIDDIDRDARLELDEGNDANRFGQREVPQGWRGSAAVTGSANNGNSDSADLTFAGRLSYGQGAVTHLFGFAGEYGESNGDRDASSAFAIYEGSYALTPELYAFGTGRFEYDRFDAFARDAFIGGGLGYRIVNTQDFAWRVQAGPGVRYLDRNGNFLDDNGVFRTSTEADQDSTDFAGIASSRIYYGLTDTVSLTNDTDILSSDTNTTVVNDLGVNFRMSETFSTRVSYRTDYNSDPAPGFDSTDNRIGLSLVVGF